MLVAAPEDLGAQTPDDVAALKATRDRGYFVGVISINELRRLLPDHGHAPAVLAGIRRQLQTPPAEGRVHVPATLDRCVAAATTHANADLTRDRNVARLERVTALVALAEPAVLRNPSTEGV